MQSNPISGDLIPERSERLLVITASRSFFESVRRCSESRASQCLQASSMAEAEELGRRELFDVVIAESSASIAAEKVAEIIQSKKSLAHCPIILSHPNASDAGPAKRLSHGQELFQIAHPLDTSKLLVKLAMIMRGKRIKKRQMQLDATIVEQNAQMRDLTERFKHELEESKSVQHSLLPEELPSTKGFELSIVYRPTEEVGGNLYDVWTEDDGSFSLFIGDVAGLGLPAAFVGAMTKMALSFAPKDRPDALLKEINRRIYDYLPDGRYVTVVSATYFPKDGRLIFSAGGLCPIFIFRSSNASVQSQMPKGFALGVKRHAEYENYETTLQAGDKVLLVNNGAIEIANMDGEVIGVKGTAKVFQQAAAIHSIGSCLDNIAERQKLFTRGRILKDGIVLIGLEREVE